jgi:Domain of unknown function (DUF4185)
LIFAEVLNIGCGGFLIRFQRIRLPTPNADRPGAIRRTIRHRQKAAAKDCAMINSRRIAIGLVIVAISIAMPSGRADAATLSLVGASSKVCQLTGDVDWATNTPTAAQTKTNFGLDSVDLGFPVDSGAGPLYFLFGDAFPVSHGYSSVPPDDALGYTTRTALPDASTCLDLQLATSAPQTFAHPTVTPAIQQGSFNVPSGGIFLDDTFYAFFWTDHCVQPGTLAPDPAAPISLPPSPNAACPETAALNSVGRSVLASASPANPIAFHHAVFPMPWRLRDRCCVGMPSGFVYVTAAMPPPEFGFERFKTWQPRAGEREPEPRDSGVAPREMGIEGREPGVEPRDPGVGPPENGAHAIEPVIRERELEIPVFGVPRYRASIPYLAMAPRATFADPATWSFYAGSSGGQPNWVTRAEWESGHNGSGQWMPPPGAEIYPAFPAGQRCVGEHSVTWNAPLHAWLLLYNCAPWTVEARTAPEPWGPWSAPTVLLQATPTSPLVCTLVMSVYGCPGLRNYWPGMPGIFYAPFVMNRYTREAGPNEATIYWLLSTWNPYQVTVMQSTLSIGP